MTTLYIGSYTPDSSGDGRGTGISRLVADPGSGALRAAGPVTPAPGPSFLARHPSGRFVYATSERPAGAVSAFGVHGEALDPLGSQPTGGDDPCHLSVDPTGRWLVTANYTSGSISVHPIGADGALGARTGFVQHTGTGPVSDRQEGPHAHQARFDPAGRYLLVTDLGTDTITTYRLDGGALNTVTRTALPPGTGPRHMVFIGDLVHVAGELAATVTTLRYETATGALDPLSSTGATGRGVAPDYPSEIARSSDGSRVYLANRGADTIAGFAATGAGLELVEEVDTGGHWPRHLTVVGDFLYVANQLSDTITIFRTAPRLTPAGEYPLPSPACLLPA